MESISVNKQVIVELAKMIEEIHDRIESLELASDSELISSLKKSKEQIKKRELVDFNDL